MKFATLVCLVGAASAAVGTDCSSNASVCATDECCGTGKKDTSVNDNQATVDVTICNTKTATTYVVAPRQYTFQCNVAAAAKTGAAQLAITGAAVLTAALYMA